MIFKKTNYIKLPKTNEAYEVIPPSPTETERGGIIASTKTDDYTVETKLGNDGKLYVPSADSAIDARIVNNFTTTEEGYIADARALKTINDNLDELNSNIGKKIEFESIPMAGSKGRAVGGTFYYDSYYVTLGSLRFVNIFIEGTIIESGELATIQLPFRMYPQYQLESWDVHDGGYDGVSCSKCKIINDLLYLEDSSGKSVYWTPSSNWFTLHISGMIYT